MNKSTEQILRKLENKKIGVFVDDSNLYHAYQKYGWRVDIGKFHKLLISHSSLEFINYYVAIPDEKDINFKNTKKFLNKIKPFVFLRSKPLKYTSNDGKILKKADFDVEITLDVVRFIDKLDVVIIASGDSDFLELKNYIVADKKKSVMFIGYEENMAWELRQCWHLYLNRIKNEVAL